MSTQWFVTRDQKKSGPFSSEQLKQFATAGKILPTDQVWKEGMAASVPAAKLAGLFQTTTEASTVSTHPVQPVVAATTEAVSEPVESSKPTFLQRAKLGAAEFAATAKTAAKLAAKQTERTKIAQVTLPSVYAELGKRLHGIGTHRQDFEALHQNIDKLLNDIQEIRSRSSEAKAPQGLMDKAKATAVAAKDLAHTKTHEVKLHYAFAELGKAIFEKNGESNSATTIQPVLDRLAALDSEISELAQSSKASLNKVKSWRFPTLSKRTKWLCVAGFAAFVVVGFFAPEPKGLHRFFPGNPNWEYKYSHSIMGGIDPVKYQSNGQFGQDFFRVKNGQLEIAADDANEANAKNWRLLIPVDVKEGDTWESTFDAASKSVMTCERLGTWDDPSAELSNYKDRAFIRIRAEDTAIQPGGSSHHFQSFAYEFAEGVGLVRWQFFPNPISKVVVEKTLVSFSKLGSSRADTPSSKTEPTIAKKVKSSDEEDGLISTGDLLIIAKNEAAAKKRFGKKTLDVQGKVVEVGEEYSSSGIFGRKKMCVTLGGRLGPNGYVNRVQCFLADEDDAAAIAPGSQIVIRGKYQDGDSMAVRLVDCEIVPD